MDNPVAANVLGTAGAVCWSVQLIPQIITNYRRHHADGVQPTMMMLWACAGLPLGVYNIASGFNVALQVQPQLLTVLSLVTWAQCLWYRGRGRGRGQPDINQGQRGHDRSGDGVRYREGESEGTCTDTQDDRVDGHENVHRDLGKEEIKMWTIRKLLVVSTAIASVMGGVQAGLVFALRQAIPPIYPHEHRLEWPFTLTAVFSAVLLSAGVLRHYWDIYQTRSVRGISFLFVAIDALGDLTSLLSLFFQVGGEEDGEKGVDVLGVVIYASELVLWIGVMVCGIVFNLGPWLRRRRQGEKREM